MSDPAHFPELASYDAWSSRSFEERMGVLRRMRAAFNAEERALLAEAGAQPVRVSVPVMSADDAERVFRSAADHSEHADNVVEFPRQFRVVDTNTARAEIVGDRAADRALVDRINLAQAQGERDDRKLKRAEGIAADVLRQVGAFGHDEVSMVGATPMVDESGAGA